MKKWIPTGRGNVIMETDEALLSYNPCMRLNPIVAVIDNITGASEEDGRETALHIENVWYILQGDFRKEYAEAFPSKKKLLTIYEKYKSEFRAVSSTD